MPVASTGLAAIGLSAALLVLLDGRSLYTPVFAGVFWDAQDLVLEDIEHIEVISGPGGVLWGANAVNGVINITTKRAAETRGAMVAAGGGDVTYTVDPKPGLATDRARAKAAAAVMIFFICVSHFGNAASSRRERMLT